MHLQSNLNFIARLESGQIVIQLLSILMLEESRSRVLFLQLLACVGAVGLTILLTRNVLLTNLMSIKNCNLVSNIYIIQHSFSKRFNLFAFFCFQVDIITIRKRCYRHEKTIRFFTS